MPGDMCEQVEDGRRGELSGFVVEAHREFDSELLGVCEEALSHRLAQPAEPSVEGELVELPGRNG